MPRIHLICRNPLYLQAIEPTKFESGYWTLYESEAQKLVSGTLYLHKKKSERSYFGGTISGYRVADGNEPYPGKIVFIVTEQTDCKDAAWEGDKHPMAWMGGILE